MRVFVVNIVVNFVDEVDDKVDDEVGLRALTRLGKAICVIRYSI